MKLLACERNVQRSQLPVFVAMTSPQAYVFIIISSILLPFSSALSLDVRILGARGFNPEFLGCEARAEIWRVSHHELVSRREKDQRWFFFRGAAGDPEVRTSADASVWAAALVSHNNSPRVGILSEDSLFTFL